MQQMEKGGQMVGRVSWKFPIQCSLEDPSGLIVSSSLLLTQQASLSSTGLALEVSPSPGEVGDHSILSGKDRSPFPQLLHCRTQSSRLGDAASVDDASQHRR